MLLKSNSNQLWTIILLNTISCFEKSELEVSDLDKLSSNDIFKFSSSDSSFITLHSLFIELLYSFSLFSRIKDQVE